MTAELSRSELVSFWPHVPVRSDEFYSVQRSETIVQSQRAGRIFYIEVPAIVLVLRLMAGAIVVKQIGNLSWEKKRLSSKGFAGRPSDLLARTQAREPHNTKACLPLLL